MSDEIRLEVGVWQGSLDALLQAIRRHALDLRTLPLTELIDQFLSCVEERLNTRSIEQTAHDLILAATLLQMRSALLLREDPEEHLAAYSAAEQIQQVLLQKDTLLQAVECFETRPVLGENVFGRGTLPPSPSAPVAAPVILTRDLLDAVLSISRRRAKLGPSANLFQPSFKPRLSVQDAMAWWQQKVREHPERTWDLAEGVMHFSPEASPQSLMQRKATWAAHLSAVLELEKRGEAHCEPLTRYKHLKIMNVEASKTD